MGTEKSQNVPKLRFKGVTGDWKQHSWKDCVDISTNMVDPTSGEFDDLPHIGPGNIESFTGQLMDNIHTVAEDGLISGKFLFHSGDIIYGKINPHLGKYSLVDFEGLASADSYVLNAKNNLNQAFLYVILQTKDFYRYSVSVSKRSGIPKINRDQLNEYQFNTPSTSEQEKIGALIVKIDALITLQQRKLSKLQDLKKALLVKMFPAEGENVPAVRFKGYEDAWEQHTVGELCQISTGKSNTQDACSDGTYPFYVRSPIVERSSRFLYDEEAVLTVGDGVGTGKVFHYVNGKYDLHQRVYRIYDFQNELDGKFFYYLFSRDFYNRIMMMSAKTSVDSVRYEMIADMAIKIPDINEQRVIAATLNSIDTSIVIHQRKLSKLKDIKKALLNNMFPGGDI